MAVIPVSDPAHAGETFEKFQVWCRSHGHFWVTDISDVKIESVTMDNGAGGYDSVYVDCPQCPPKADCRRLIVHGADLVEKLKRLKGR